MSQLGAVNQEHIAQGRWLEVDPAVRRHVDEFDSVLDVAVDTRKVWWNAVAAQAVLKLQQDMEEASSAAAELARRMARVGNWSRMEQAQSQSKLGNVKLQALKSATEAKHAQIALLKALKLWGISSSVGLGILCPMFQSSSIAADTMQKGLKAVRAVLPRSEGLRVQATAQQAFDIYKASYRCSPVTGRTKLRQFIYDETVLRYNGMLADSLGSSDRDRDPAAIWRHLINTKRDLSLRNLICNGATGWRTSQLL